MWWRRHPPGEGEQESPGGQGEGVEVDETMNPPFFFIFLKEAILFRTLE